MSVLKAIAHFLSAFLLILVVSAGVSVLALSLNLTNRNVVSSWPVEAGTYNHLTESIFELMRQGDNGQDLEADLQNSLLKADGLAEAAASVLTPQYWQAKFESILNPTYDWLEGTVSTPSFVLSFADAKEPLSSALEEEVTSQLNGAPTCAVAGGDFDIMSATCLPPGVSPAEASQEFTSELFGTDSPLTDVLLTGQDLTEEAPEAPNAFGAATAWPWQFIVILLILTLLMGFSGKTPLRGFRRAGQTLFASGLIMWAGFYIAQKLVQNFSVPADETNAEVVNELVNPLVRTVTTSVATTGMWVSLAVVIAGILVWLGTFFWHKVHHGDEAKAIAEKAKAQKEADLPKPVAPKT